MGRELSWEVRRGFISVYFFILGSEGWKGEKLRRWFSRFSLVRNFCDLFLPGRPYQTSAS